MRRAAILLCALGALGCEGPSFDPPHLVRGPRLLALRSEPAEAAPGEDVTLSATLARAPGATVRWSVELDPHALASSAGQTLFEPRDPIELTGSTIDGARTAAAIDALYAQIGDAPAGTPEAVVRQVYEQVGLLMVVRAEVRGADGALIAEGFERVGLSPRADRSANPPPPRVRVGEAWVSARGGEPERCAPEDATPTVAAGATITLSPDPDEPWLEPYPALDLDGEVIEGMENAYYSWFATDGDFVFSVTRAPEREVEWTAPADPGEVTMWVVVRDGHFGASACEWTVRVE